MYKATKEDQIRYAVIYGEFMYQAGPWDYPRRVVFKIEKPYGQLMHMYTFIVTNMDMEPYQIIQFYCGRSRMENFIKEGKSGFDFAAVSSHSKVVKASHACVQLIQLVQTIGTSCKYAKATGGYHSFKADKDCRKSSPFSKIYHFQTV